MNEQTPDLVPAQKAKLVSSSTRAQFLRVSTITRGGKFIRVSEEALNKVLVELETQIRRLDNAQHPYCEVKVELPEGERLLTGYGRELLGDAMDRYLAAFIQDTVNKNRTGKTIV